jgi:hypothetical protein
MFRLNERGKLLVRSAVFVPGWESLSLRRAEFSGSFPSDRLSLPRGSVQNRPYEMARDVILFIPLSPDQASLFWFSNSAARI